MNLLEKLHQQIVQSDWSEKFKEEKKMDKEKLMQLVSLAFEKGASVSVHFPQFDKSNDWKPVSGAEALQLASFASEAMGTNIEEYHHSEGVCQGMKVEKEGFRFSFSHSPRGYLIEDVDLSGGEEIA